LVEAGKLPPGFFQDSLIHYIDTLLPMKPSEVPHVRGLKQYLKFHQNFQEEWFKTLTVKQLLNHTGGLGDWMAPAPGYNMYPGERFDYCDDCYILLQRVVEHYLQENLQSLVNHYLPKSCKGVKQFAWDNKQTNYAFGHFANMDLMRDIWKTSEGLAHGTLASSARGYAKFVQTIASQQHWNQTIDTVFVSDGLYWQPGWGVEKTQIGPLFWHWGNDGCYQHVVYYDPVRDFGLVVFANSQHGLYFSQTIANRVFGYKLKSLSWVLGN
jgi:CubicO group peptidase (beta-lactamase class C family)